MDVTASGGEQPNHSISLLGPFEVCLAVRPVNDQFRTRKERALLAYLATNAGRIQQRENLAELLWPERPEGYARTNLRQALYGLRRALGVAGSMRKIHSFKDAQDIVDTERPAVIINCIGYTGERNVDDCENQKNKTMEANTVVPLVLGEVAARNNVKLVHISSGCIYRYDYATQRPITEDDPPDYYDLFYSRTKIYAEKALAFMAKKYNVLIARIRIPLDNRPHPRNILTKLLGFDRVIDVPNSLTYIPDFFVFIIGL